MSPFTKWRHNNPLRSPLSRARSLWHTPYATVRGTKFALCIVLSITCRAGIFFILIRKRHWQQWKWCVKISLSWCLSNRIWCHPSFYRFFFSLFGPLFSFFPRNVPRDFVKCKTARQRDRPNTLYELLIFHPTWSCVLSSFSSRTREQRKATTRNTTWRTFMIFVTSGQRRDLFLSLSSFPRKVHLPGSSA